MSKNNNTLKNPKSLHKRVNSNSYTNSNSTNSNISQNFSNINPTNQSELLINTTSNMGNTINQNLFNLNMTQMTQNTQIRDPNVTSQLGNLNNNTLNLNQNTVDVSKTQNNYGNSEDFKSLLQKIDCVGKVPTARFGHTIVLVSPVKIILFGGAVGDTRNFQFTNDTYVLNLITKIWLKLEGRVFKYILI